MKSSRPSSVPPTAETPEAGDGGSFLSRWSRRKAAVREGRAVAPEPVVPAPAPVASAPQGAAARADENLPPPPTLADVAMLKPGDGIARFVTRGVDEQVKRAALKTLFADPHFNVMDGLDIYIDDYSKPDPIPPHILRQLRQSEALGLFDPVEDEDERTSAAAAPAAGDDVPESTEAAIPEQVPTEPGASPAPLAGTAPGDGGEGQAALRQAEVPQAQPAEAARQDKPA